MWVGIIRVFFQEVSLASRGKIPPLQKVGGKRNASSVVARSTPMRGTAKRNRVKNRVPDRKAGPEDRGGGGLA